MKKYFIVILFISCLYSLTMEIDTTIIRDSQKAKTWSLIPIVSQGQLYNGKHLKSLVFVGAQSYSLNRMIYHNKFSDKDSIIDRNRAGWWFIASYVFSILDAYIDAELSGFIIKE